MDGWIEGSAVVFSSSLYTWQVNIGTGQPTRVYPAAKKRKTPVGDLYSNLMVWHDKANLSPTILTVISFFFCFVDLYPDSYSEWN